jgi:very-short-patch-repair endonuclease
MTRIDVDGTLRQLAGSQHGVVARAQAAALGFADVHLRRRVTAGAWEVATPRVLRMAGSQRSFEKRCVIAVLDAGHAAVVRGAAAARLWGLPGFDDPVIEVTRMRRRSRRGTRPITASEPRLLPPHHRTVHRDVPVTTAERTIFDLMGAVPAGRAERALDNALARKLTTVRALRSIGEELCRKGRPGSKLFRKLLADRGVDFRPTESGLEDAFLTLVRHAGLPEPENQVELGGEEWIGRVDFYFRDARLVVEVDSDLFHAEALDAAADRRRDEAFRGAGFAVVRITEEDLRERPSLVGSRVMVALQQRAA